MPGGAQQGGQDGAKWLRVVSSSQSAEGELHYIQIGDGGMGGGPGGGGSSVSTEVTEWVQKNGTAVKASEYGSASDSSSQDDQSSQNDQSTVYRLHPSDVTRRLSACQLA
ncbi:hypothetical protein [Streptomyces sp. UG1]|uniref:hypothetical protein n=1 Tax=Streptomyces sp. UG1 TaxID=3417652 RepID=UPI003CF67FF6